LKFNPNKSKVLVVGKRIDKSNKWVLGDTYIEETNEYKYLGVYFSRSVKPTHHIGNHIKDNIDNKLKDLSMRFPTTNTFDLFELNSKFHFVANEEAILSSLHVRLGFGQ
jgi:hypothetical protein